jgi:hypothetical protein
MKKKYILFLVILISTITSFSQSFMGITIDGTQSAIKSKLVEKGFKFISGKDNGYMYEGKLNNEDISIMVMNTVLSKKVYSFYIKFSSIKDSWNQLESEFDNKNLILNEKYGTPIKEERVYEYPFDENDGMHLTALESGKLSYLNIWNKVGENKLLQILLAISKEKNIVMMYSNSLNREIAIKEELKQNKNNY